MSIRQSLSRAARGLLAAVGLCLAAHASAAQDGLAALATLKPVMDCAAVSQLDLSSAVGAATRVVAAASRQDEGHEVCEVKGEIAPHITFLARLPEQGWSQRYLQTGCGGLCGVLDIRADHAEGCSVMGDGSLVLASTDMGHQGKFMGDGEFGRDPQARIDFAYRGVHLTAVAVQALIKQFYGQPARYRYFSGCSDGGREALMEAQRYPDDFDGIAAGAPAMNFQVQNSFYHAWQARSNTGADGKTILTADKLPMLHAAVLKACDGIDGQVDGVIQDPRACKFDPVVLRCTPGQDPHSCLTDAQVETVRKLYAGPTDAAGHRFTAGGPQYGSELAWQGVFVSGSPEEPVPSTFMALGSLKNVIFPDRPVDSYGINDFSFDVATFERLKPMHAMNDATNPDLVAFVGHGGKLMLWHGWSDPHISPLNTIAYYSAVKRVVGAAKADEAVRLFVIPGLYHCGGGEGPVEFDLLTPLMRWVESQHAPEQLTMSVPTHVPPWAKPDGGPSDGKGPSVPPPGAEVGKSMARAPSRSVVFAYPALSKYLGKGDRADPANYAKNSPAFKGSDDPQWEGASLMTPGFQRNCQVDGDKPVCDR